MELMWKKVFKKI